MSSKTETAYQKALQSDPLFWEHVGVAHEARRARLDLMTRPDVFKLSMARAYFAYLQRFGTDGPYRVAESHVCEYCLRDAVYDQKLGRCQLCMNEANFRCAPDVHARFMAFPLIDPDKGASCPLCAEYLPAPDHGLPDLKSWGASPKKEVTVDFDQDRYIAHTYYADVIMPGRERRSAERIGELLDRDEMMLRDVPQELTFTYLLGFENWLNDVAVDPIPSHRHSALTSGDTGLVPSGQATIAAVLDAMGFRPRSTEVSGKFIFRRQWPWQSEVGVFSEGVELGIQR